MSNWEVVTCPHCKMPSAIKVDTHKYQVQDVHTERKTFDELQAHEQECECMCDRCEKPFYVTFIEKSPAEKKGILTYKKVI